MLNEYLSHRVHVVVDRPIGSRHPDHPDLIYPVNYGYLPGTLSGDGEEIDCYIVGEFEPLTEYEGVVVAVIRRLNDVEDKLVVARSAGKYNADQIRALTEFQERFFPGEIVT